jgi:hypothetical protein
MIVISYLGSWDFLFPVVIAMLSYKKAFAPILVSSVVCVRPQNIYQIVIRVKHLIHIVFVLLVSIML